MQIHDGTGKGSGGLKLRLGTSFLTATLIQDSVFRLGSSPPPPPIQMIITWVLEVPEAPSRASDNPSSCVKQLEVFPLPGEIRDFVVYWPRSGVEAKKGLCMRDPEQAYCRTLTNNEGNW